MNKSFCCSECGGHVAKRLLEDIPGEHTYRFTCRNCWVEFGPEWVTRHWGFCELEPDIDLPPWFEDSITVAA